MANEELTLKQAGELPGVTRRHFHAMVQQGQLTAERRQAPICVNYLVVQRAAVERFMRERRAAAEGRSDKRRPGPRPNAAADVA